MTALPAPTAARPYANPYVAGVGLGLVLLAAFVLTGRGLGASGAFAAVATGVVSSAAPATAASNSYFQSYLAGGNPWTAWLVFEILGVLAGGALSAWLAGRLHARIERGPNLAATPRLAIAAGGGVIMGVGAVLARGCTSGQALSGGALLSVGSWLFMIAVFVSGYLTAPLVRRLWR
jgi:uncharacterized membrane protein YedE/YeeE